MQRTVRKRPVVRSFSARDTRRAATHVRAGGHAVVWDGKRRARLVVPLFDPADDTSLDYYAILDLSKHRYRVVSRGHLAGLIETRVPTDGLHIVRHRIARDAAHAGPVRTVALSCFSCGACCTKNEVVVDERDMQRLERARRTDLLAPGLVRRRRGTVTLRLTKSGACHHLGQDNRCAIYEVRPGMCREFPVGSECCLSARAEDLGLDAGS
jgi:hypothetical protein